MFCSGRPARVPKGHDIGLGVWYFEAWRHFCVWFIKADENQQTAVQWEWKKREERYQQALVLEFLDSMRQELARSQVGEEMAVIFSVEYTKYRLEQHQLKLEESALKIQKQLDEVAKESSRERMESLARWKLIAPEGNEEWKDNKAEEQWQQQLQHQHVKQQHVGE